MSELTIDGIVGEAVKLILARTGIQLDEKQFIAAVRQGAVLLAGVIDEQAKKKAVAAGDAAGEAITTEDQAEAAQRSKP